MLLTEQVPAPAPTTPASVPGRAAAALTGALAAGAALAAGELAAAAVHSVTSPVTAVGGEFVDRFAGSLKQFAVDTFGTNDKPALVTGIVITSILLGAVLGLAARQRWIVAPLGFAVFGLVGVWAMITDPQDSTGDAIFACLVSVLAGIGTFVLLWRLATPHAATPAAAAWEPETPTSTVKVRQTVVDRRGFLAGVAGVVVLTGSATALSRRIRSGDSVNGARRTTVLPRPTRSVLPPASQPFDVDGLTPYVVPNGDFYRIDTALLVPQIGASAWSISIKGMVDNPFSITYDELLAMDSVEETVTLSCVSNEVGGHLVGNAVWQGVPLTALLERAGVQSGAEQVVGRSGDGFTAGFPVSAATDGRTALVAYAMNGEPLPAEHGYPARLVVAGLYGYVSATKWLTEIELNTWDDVRGYWTTRGWSREAPIKTQSRIDVPKSNADLAAGPQPIAGVAWAPNRGIAKVEVQVDGGDWQECELGRVASDDTWVQWQYAWDAASGDHTIVARATDGEGQVQTDDVAPPAPDGATGWPHRACHVR